MFNVGPLELVVLAIVGVVVVGPDRLPNLARDAARIIRQLRDVATGARDQLRDELGPEFADIDLRNLNPRTALQRAVLGEELNLGKFDPRRWDARNAAENLLREDAPVSLDKSAGTSWVSTDAPAAAAGGAGARWVGERPRPRPRPTARVEHAPFDADAT